ncbi:hypothetical protein QTJ16_007068 [Diplocarpon rosae]|uniref:Uncharacterized protein n=1 Tax=Diplocarpon rosae TaxID=946125 RepID=A0AAD9SV53_9HELO|nr:hypothetical protein QTJ16_007068 [Diplocarpon rosae]
MCGYTQVEYRCYHHRYIVRAWCKRYQDTHQRCPPILVGMKWRPDEECGDCRQQPVTNQLSILGASVLKKRYANLQGFIPRQ